MDTHPERSLTLARTLVSQRELPSTAAQLWSYHERTKHAPGRYAASLGYLDWANQPNPFLRYQGAPRVSLPRHLPEARTLFDEAYAPAFHPGAMDAAGLSRLLYNAVSLSGWKRSGQSYWSMRVNPSSGNLHPTECYLLLSATAGVCDRPCVAHYNVFDHALEIRAELSDRRFSELAAHAPSGACFVALSSIVWREAWKYGERAFRYCQHDVGHALAALSLSAHVEGLCVRPIDVEPRVLAAWLGLHDAQVGEAQHPETLLCISHGPSAIQGPVGDVPLIDGARWYGRPMRLSSEHHAWPVLEEVQEALLTTPVPPVMPHGDHAPPELPVRLQRAQTIIRSRRSAVDMDGVTPMGAQDFARICDRLMPVSDHAPWCALRARPRIHLALLVHRVEGVEPGAYFLCRHAADLPALASCLHEPLTLYQHEAASERAPLFLLRHGDFRSRARALCCEQNLAADGAFCVAMFADLRAALAERGAHAYRELHWEAGAIGQVLYLEATALGLSGTGIGCFHDDMLSSAVGADLRAMRMLYGFTVGGAEFDARLLAQDAYFHLDRKVEMALH